MPVATRDLTARIGDAVERRPAASTVAGGLCTSASSVFVALAASSTGTVSFFRFVIAAPLLAPLALAESRERPLRATSDGYTRRMLQSQISSQDGPGSGYPYPP